MLSCALFTRQHSVTLLLSYRNTRMGYKYRLNVQKKRLVLGVWLRYIHSKSFGTVETPVMNYLPIFLRE